MDIIASVEAGDMKYAVAERQADNTQPFLAVEEASMSEVISTEIPITVRKLPLISIDSSLGILVASYHHIKAKLVFNDRKHVCESFSWGSVNLYLTFLSFVCICLFSLHFPDLLPLLTSETPSCILSCETRILVSWVVLSLLLLPINT
jgi:hypothetical protein